MKAREIESTVQATLAADPVLRPEAVDILLQGLLPEHFALRARATDGYVARREEVTTDTYFSVGKL